MSHTSRALTNLGESWFRGQAAIGQTMRQGAEFDLKRAGLEHEMERQRRLRPIEDMQVGKANEYLRQQERLNQPFSPNQLMNTIPMVEMGLSKDEDGRTGVDRFAELVFGEGSRYDPEGHRFIKADNSNPTNRDYIDNFGKVQQWYMMNLSPYRTARTFRDQAGIALEKGNLPPQQAQALRQKRAGAQAFMVDPDKKLQALQNLQATISNFDNPQAEKAVARLDKEIAIVRAEKKIKETQDITLAKSFTPESVKAFRTSGDVSDLKLREKVPEKVKYAKWLAENKELADKLGLTKKDTPDWMKKVIWGEQNPELAKKYGIIKDKGPTAAKQKLENETTLRHLIGRHGLKQGFDGNFEEEITAAKLQDLTKDARAKGFEVYSTPGEKEEHWFSDDVQKHKILDIVPVSDGSGGTRARIGGGPPAQQMKPADVASAAFSELQGKNYDPEKAAQILTARYGQEAAAAFLSMHNTRPKPKAGVATAGAETADRPESGGAQKPTSRFDPDGSGYDYVTARMAGMKKDPSGHMGSVAPVPPDEAKRLGIPENSYVLLKGRKHESWNKAVAAEEKRGYRVVRGTDGRYYSVPAVSHPLESVGKAMAPAAKAFQERVTDPRIRNIPDLMSGY